MLTGSPILAEFGIQKESRKEFENEKQKLPNVEIHNEMPVRTQPCISKQMVISKLQVLVYYTVLTMSHRFHFQAWLGGD